MGAKAVVRRGLAIAALVAFNVAAAASVMRRRLALSGASQAARAGVGVPRDALVRARLQALARAVVLARKLRDLPFDVVGPKVRVQRVRLARHQAREQHALVADWIVYLAPHLLVRAPRLSVALRARPSRLCAERLARRGFAGPRRTTARSPGLARTSWLISWLGQIAILSL